MGEGSARRERRRWIWILPDGIIAGGGLLASDAEVSRLLTTGDVGCEDIDGVSQRPQLARSCPRQTARRAMDGPDRAAACGGDPLRLARDDGHGAGHRRRDDRE